MATKVELTDDQIRVILGLIDCNTSADIPDHFWDEEKQMVFYYAQPSGKKTYMSLDEFVQTWLNYDKLGI